MSPAENAASVKQVRKKIEKLKLLHKICRDDLLHKPLNLSAVIKKHNQEVLVWPFEATTVNYPGLWHIAQIS